MVKPNATNLLQKKIITINMFLVLLILNADGQNIDSINHAAKTSNTSIRFVLQLPEYRASACISAFLLLITKSTSKPYNTDKIFYSLTFRKGKKFKYLNITQGELDKSENVDFKGYIKFAGSNILFLCRGDFDNDIIFHKSDSNKIEIKLTKVDSSNLSVSFIEPSLEGIFYGCEGLPIHISIYTENKINGVTRIFRKPTIKKFNRPKS